MDVGLRQAPVRVGASVVTGVADVADVADGTGSATSGSAGLAGLASLASRTPITEKRPSAIAGHAAR